MSTLACAPEKAFLLVWAALKSLSAYWPSNSGPTEPTLKKKNPPRGVSEKKHLSYYGDRGSKTAKAYYRRVVYRAWGFTANRGWSSIMLDRRSLVQAPSAPQDQSQHPRARTDYDEETAYESYMNPEPGFQSGPGTL